MATVQRDATKQFFTGTHRTRDPEDTWLLATGLFDRCGISRVADVTGLDVLGIPTWVAVRPLASTLSVSQGKGATDTAAKVSACMEAIELWYAENTPATPGPHTATAAELSLPYDVSGLQRAARSLLTADTLLPWVPAEIIGNQDSTLVPEPCVSISSAATADWSPPLLRVTSNGLASGNCAEEAALHALFELVERDSTADLGQRLVEQRHYIAPDTVDDPGCADLIGRVRAAGTWLELVDNTRDPHFPCYVAYLWSPEDPSVYSGSGCHSDPAVALSRAITEAAQSRLTVINGTRDDVRGSLYRSHRWDTTEPVTPADRTGSWQRAVDRVHRLAFDAVDEELLRCAELVSTRTGQPVLRVALSTPDEPLAVVRVIAPGLRFGTGDECPTGHRNQELSSMSTHVFAGPTITAERIAELLPGVCVHPPVQHGDLLRVPFDGGDTALILDGFFLQAPAVRHKEILHLVHSGVRVVGASSMGALRAAELHRYGMVGIGQVFQWYAGGTVTGDDEVAVAHLPAEDGYRQLSDALVSLRYGLGRAVGSATTPAEHDELLATAAALPFAQRSWTSLWRVAGTGALADAAARVREHLAAHPADADVKLVDAELALRWVLDNPVTGSTPSPRPSTLDTVYLADWLWENVPRGESKVSDHHALAFLRLFLPAFPAIHRHTALAAIGGDADGALATARARGLLGSGDEPTAGMREWLTDQELATGSGRELVLTGLVRSFRTAPGVRTGHALPELVARSPELVRLARTCASVAGGMNQARRDRHPDFQVEHVRADLVQEFFAARWACQDLESACWDRGLTGIEQLHEFGRYFLLLARSGRVPEQALAAVTVGATSNQSEESR